MVKKSQVTPSGIIKDAAKQLAEYYSERFSEHRANLRKKAGNFKDKLSNINLPTISTSHSKSRKNHRHTLGLGKISIVCAAFFLPMVIVFCAATNTHQESDDQQQSSSQSETISSTDRVTIYNEESTSDEPTLLKPDKSKKTYSSSGYRNYDEGPLPYDEGDYSYNYDPGPITVYDSIPSYSEPTQTTTDEPDQTETETTTDDSETTDSTEPETTTTTDDTGDQSSTESEPTTTTEPTESATTESTEEP